MFNVLHHQGSEKRDYRMIFQIPWQRNESRAKHPFLTRTNVFLQWYNSALVAVWGNRSSHSLLSFKKSFVNACHCKCSFLFIQKVYPYGPILLKRSQKYTKTNVPGWLLKDHLQQQTKGNNPKPINRGDLQQIMAQPPFMGQLYSYFHRS